MKQLNKLPIRINNVELKLIDSNFSNVFILTQKIKTLQNEIKNARDNRVKEEKKREKEQKEKERDKILNEFFWKLSSDIHQLLFFKDMVEKALIYARYHAKAMGD